MVRGKHVSLAVPPTVQPLLVRLPATDPVTYLLVITYYFIPTRQWLRWGWDSVLLPLQARDPGEGQEGSTTMERKDAPTGVATCGWLLYRQTVRDTYIGARACIPPGGEQSAHPSPTTDSYVNP